MTILDHITRNLGVVALREFLNGLTICSFSCRFLSFSSDPAAFSHSPSVVPAAFRHSPSVVSISHCLSVIPTAFSHSPSMMPVASQFFFIHE